MSSAETAEDRLHVGCPHCGAINRVPAPRLADRPNCGQCHRALYTGRPIALDAAGFERHASRSDIPLVVDFWAAWCAPCRMMAPAYERAAALLEPDFRLARIDTEAERGLAARFGIRSIPTLAIFLGGRELARQAGAMGTEDIVRWVRAHAPSR